MQTKQLRFFSTSLIASFLVLGAGCVDGAELDLQDELEVRSVLVEDLDTQTLVLIEVEGEQLTLTNLLTDEVVVVEGELPVEMSDEIYTQMLREKQARLENELAGGESIEVPELGPEDQNEAQIGKCSFSFWSSFKCPNYYKPGSDPVRTYTSITSYYDGNEPVWIKLYRDVPWSIFNQGYGTKYYFTSNGWAGGWYTWSSATTAGDYYLKVDKDTSTWVVGSVTLHD